MSINQPARFTFDVQIVTPDDHVYSGSVTQLIVKGSEGEMCIHYGHAPLLTKIMPCMLTLQSKSGEKKLLYVAGGFMEVQPYNVSILADTLVRAEDIDEKKAQQARDNAERQLKVCKGDDLIRLELELMQALAKLRIVKNFRQY